MSRNAYTRFSPIMANGQLGTAYSPSAEGSAEGDILGALNVMSAEVGPREDDPDMGVSAYDRLQGLREDDANLQMGAAWAPNAEGSSEGDYGWSSQDEPTHGMGVSAYDRLDVHGARRPCPLTSCLEHGMGVSAYDRLDGLREDDADIRMGRSSDAGAGATGFAEGSAEGLRTEQLGFGMGGILVSDGSHGAMLSVSAYDRLGVSAYDQVIEGLREDDADICMGGLREDDADIRMGGLREDDADIRMGGLREDDADIRMGGLREDDANVRMEGLREDDADIRMGGLREEDANIQLSGLREEDANISLTNDVLSGLREDDAGITFLTMEELREDDAGLQIGSIRAAMMLRGLADPVDMVEEMGRRRLVRHMRRKGRYGPRRLIKGSDEMGVSAYDRLGAEDFHPRFPAVMIEGLGTMGGIFDFLKSEPTPEEYIGKIKVVLDGWKVVKPQLMALPERSRNAIINQMKSLKNDPERYDGLAQFLSEGYEGYKASPGRWERVKRLEAYLPTVQAMVSRARALGPAPTPAEEEKRAKEAAVTNIETRINAVEKPSFIQEAAPYAAGALGAGAIVGLVLALS